MSKVLLAVVQEVLANLPWGLIGEEVVRWLKHQVQNTESPLDDFGARQVAKLLNVDYDKVV